MASHWSILPSFLVESNVTTGRWTLNLPRRKGEINEESLSFVYRMACYFATLQFDNVLVYNYQEGHCPWKLRFVSWVSERGPAAIWQMWLYCQEVRQHIITDVSGTPLLCIPRNMSVWQAMSYRYLGLYEHCLCDCYGHNYACLITVESATSTNKYWAVKFIWLRQQPGFDFRPCRLFSDLSPTP